MEKCWVLNYAFVLLIIIVQFILLTYSLDFFKLLTAVQIKPRLGKIDRNAPATFAPILSGHPQIKEPLPLLLPSLVLSKLFLSSLILVAPSWRILPLSPV